MNKRILLVDDEQSVLSTLKRLFRNLPYDVRYALSGQEALGLLSEESADLIISDMRMPEMDGAEFLAIAKERFPLTERVLITGYADMESTIKAINDAGIFGYISKPWNAKELLNLVKNALDQTHKNRLKNRTLKRFKRDNDALGMALKQNKTEISKSTELIEETILELEDNYKVTAQMLLNMLDMRSKGEREFAHKVALVASQVAELLNLSGQDKETLTLAARLHGVGKIGLSDDVLAQTIDGLTDEQFIEFKEHPAHGACALMSYAGFQEVAQVIFEQKEYLDGDGYPSGLTEHEISLLGKVLALVLDYGELRFGKTNGISMAHDQAISALQTNRSRYDSSLFPILSSINLSIETSYGSTATLLPLFSLRSGMILNQDVSSDSGILLLPKDTVLTEALIGHLMTIEKNSDQKLLVKVRFDEASI